MDSGSFDNQPVDLKDSFQDESIHDRWESVYRGNALQDRFNDQMLDLLIEECGLTRGTVLDAGCGIGDHAFRFARRGFQTVGVDVSEPMLEHARRTAADLRITNVNFVQASLETLSLDRQFDLIHCRGVLMHIPNWKAALNRICSHLGDGGKIMLWENNHRSVEMKITRVLALLRKPTRRRVVTSDGIEFYDGKSGYAPLTRVANFERLGSELEKLKIDIVKRRTSEFFDINRFPAGIMRNTAIRMNRVAFRFPTTHNLACGNVIIGCRPVA